MSTASDDRLERVLKVVVKAMVKHTDIFPQSRIAKEYAEKVLELKGNDASFYHYVTLETRIGLAFVVKKKLEAMDEIFWALDSDQMDSLRIPIAKSVLMHYLQTSPSREELETFKSIKNELYW